MVKLKLINDSIQLYINIYIIKSSKIFYIYLITYLKIIKIHKAYISIIYHNFNKRII